MITVVPAIDIINGKCVRLTQGDYAQQITYGDPMDMALRFQDHGINRLHLVDLDGAKAKKVVNYRILEQIAGKTDLIIDAGGGIRSLEDLRIVFESGAAMATGGSVAVKDPELFKSWLESYGPRRIILGSDFSDGKIAVSGWQESAEEPLAEFLERWTDLGISQTICTDVSKDGMLQGPSMGVYRDLMERFPQLEIIASGGVSGIKDIEALSELGIPAVIVGKAIYEGKIALKELERFNR